MIKQQFEHVFSLHLVDEDPEVGFVYREHEEDLVKGTCNLWNSYTPATCPHKRLLQGRPCQLCGKKYTVTKLPHRGL